MLFSRPAKNPDGRTPVSSATYRQALYRWLERCDVRDEHGQPGHLTPHQWRHAAATRMLRDGVPIEVVSKVMGHSSAAVTSSVYGHLTAEDARRALEAAGWFSATGNEVTAILDAHGDLPLLTWTVGPAGSVLAGRVSGLFPAAQARDVFSAWREGLSLEETREDQMSGGTTVLHAAARGRGVTVRLNATVRDDEDGDL